MKRETQADKLAALLGLGDDLVEEEKVTSNVKSKYVPGINEPNVGTYRIGEAVTLFFQAPKLFTFVECSNCKMPFAVSRKHVRHCSAVCLREVMARDGMTLRDDYGSPAYIDRVWTGNEPLIIPPDVLRTIKDMLDEHYQLIEV